ncbi:MAG TPA: hypothetical protein VK032_03260, partial [Burkholderiaceae bacterium]|nr:hypothetical protein [Burkholderiaceae bacterium]
AIAVAEFAVNQPITDLPLNNFRLLPFNLPHANTAAELWHLLGQKRPTGTPRHVARDDIKLIAQATHEGIQFIFTEDKATLYRYCERLNKISQQVVRSVVLANGYDSAVFSNNPQKGLDFESS